MNNPPYSTLSGYLRTRFGERVQKIPLDAGFNCPNRDGTLSHEGCIFCNERGSGSGLGGKGLSLAAQWKHWKERFEKKYKARLFMGYLQSFSNTYGPAEKLARALNEMRHFSGLAGIAVGTRPDCLDQKKIRLLAAFPARDKWLDLGLQSSNNETLLRINRGHDAAAFAEATNMAAEAGLKVCAHVIAGLPGETGDDFLASVEFVNALPIAGIKLHNLYVCKGTGMARLHEAGEYSPPTMDEYVEWACEALARLRPDIIIHRLNGDPSGDELLAPVWAADKQTILQAINTRLKRAGITQGCNNQQFDNKQDSPT